MNFVLVMLARHLAVERRSLKLSFVRLVLQPAIYLFVFGYVVGRLLPAAGGSNYAAVMAPGVIAIAVMSAPYTLVGSAILTGFYFRTMEAWLLSPVSLRRLFVAFVAGGVIYGVVSALVVAVLVWAILGLVPGRLPLLFGLVILGSTFFSLLAVIGLLLPETPRRGQEFFSFLMLPMTYFGCTFYSFDMLDPMLRPVALILPTTYLSEGLRAAYAAGSGGLPTEWLLLGLTLTTAALVPVADRVFARRMGAFTW